MVKPRYTLPPPSSIPHVTPGQTTFDRTVFDSILKIQSIVLPSSAIGECNASAAFVERCNLPEKVRNVVPVPGDDNLKRLLITTDLEPLPQELTQFLGTKTDHPVEIYNYRLDYEYYSVPQVFRALLPEHLQECSPAAFSHLGHIAHVNLKDEYLPFKNLIGQVMLDKNKSLRTVVNKVGTIHSTYRYFDMEVLAGDHDFNVNLLEQKCKMQFDFSKVYFNSRLGHEHERIVNLFGRAETVADVFAGVGPFALPAAKKGCFVLANDLNPEAKKALDVNINLNGQERAIRSFELDGKTFIRESHKLLQKCMPWSRILPKEVIPKMQKKSKINPIEEQELQTVIKQTSIQSKDTKNRTVLARKSIDHYVMNLPDTALEFLDAFREVPNQDVQPMIHCHCFNVEPDVASAEQSICERASRNLGMPVTPGMPGYYLEHVRKVAPKKEMYCLGFRLPNMQAEP